MLNIKNYEDLKKLDSVQIYCLLRNYELCIGEDFLDYNENYINRTNLAFYLLGVGAINISELNRCINKKVLAQGDLNELFEEFEIRSIYRLKFLADLTVNFDTLLKRLFQAYKDYSLDFEISVDLLEKIRPELKELY
jgi:hypothetical protein